MTGRLKKVKHRTKFSAKYILLAFFVCISMVAWLGLSDLRADEDDPDDNNNGSEVLFQNSAQEQKADDVARQAALQDPLVNKLIEQERYRRARAVYLGKVETYTDQITEWRAEGMGWGWITHQLGVHSSILGRAHTPMSYREYVHHHKHSTIKSRSKNMTEPTGLAYAAESYHYKSKGLALGHSKNKSSNRGGGNGGGKGGGNGNGKK